MNLMDWALCEKEHIRKVTPDNERVESIKEMAFKRLKFTQSQEAKKENISFIIEGYYEVIKELLVALLLKDGLKSKNHQCLISYFYKKYPDYGFEANLISQMSYFRNRLNYYGEQINPAFYEKNKKDIIKLIELLIKVIK